MDDRYGTAQKMKFSTTDFFSKCEQICRFPRIWSHLLKQVLVGNFIFCVVWGRYQETELKKKDKTKEKAIIIIKFSPNNTPIFKRNALIQNA